MIIKCLGRVLLKDTRCNGLLLQSHTWFKMASRCLSSKIDHNDNLREITPYKHVTHVIFDMDGLLLGIISLFAFFYDNHLDIV